MDWLQEGEQRRRQGDESGAIEAFRQAAELAKTTFDPVVEAKAQLNIGELELVRDDLKAAREALDQAIARAMEGGVPLVEADAWFSLSAVCFDHGLSKDGHDALLEAMALYRELADASPTDESLKRRLARSIRVYGEHLGILGTESDANQALELARIMYADFGDADVAQSIAEEMARLRDYAR